MLEGINSLDKKTPVSFAADAHKAINKAIKNAKDGSFIVIIRDIIPDAIKQITELKEKENKVKVRKADIPNSN